MKYVFQCRPLSIGRDMPPARTQAPRIVTRIPVVQPAVGPRRCSHRCHNHIALPCSILLHAALSVILRYSRAISVHRRPQVLRKPALVANLHHGVSMPSICHISHVEVSVRNCRRPCWPRRRTRYRPHRCSRPRASHCRRRSWPLRHTRCRPGQYSPAPLNRHP